MAPAERARRQIRAGWVILAGGVVIVVLGLLSAFAFDVASPVWLAAVVGAVDAVLGAAILQSGRAVERLCQAAAPEPLVVATLAEQLEPRTSWWRRRQGLGLTERRLLLVPVSLLGVGEPEVYDERELAGFTLDERDRRTVLASPSLRLRLPEAADDARDMLAARVRGGGA